MKKLSHFLILTLSLGLVSLPSCKDKEDPAPEPEVVVQKDTITPVIFRRRVTLYLPQNDDDTNTEFKFYNVLTGELSNDVTSAIHMAFYFDDQTETGTKHHIGSSRANIIRDKFGIPDSNKTDVKFYKINNNFSSAVFDTLNDTRTLARYFDDQDLAVATSSGKVNRISSGEFGWEENDIFGFEVSSGTFGLNGTFGLIKLRENPEVNFLGGDVDNGRITFDIKLEHQP